MTRTTSAYDKHILELVNEISSLANKSDSNFRPKRPNLAAIEDIVSFDVEEPTTPGPQIDSVSQYGEDLIIIAVLNALRAREFQSKSLTYLDVGCNHPISTNNTWKLYCQGFSGVLVEPNPLLIPIIADARPRDTLLDCGVKYDNEHDRATLFVPNRHELASFSNDFVQEYYKDRKLPRGEVVLHEVVLRDINEIIKTELSDRSPDFLSIDVEALDFPMLTTLDLNKYRPSLICIEPSDRFIRLDGERNSERIKRYLADFDYMQIASTAANDIYVNVFDLL
jgi:hypothetical protein